MNSSGLPGFLYTCKSPGFFAGRAFSVLGRTRCVCCFGSRADDPPFAQTRSACSAQTSARWRKLAQTSLTQTMQTVWPHSLLASLLSRALLPGFPFYLIVKTCRFPPRPMPAVLCSPCAMERLGRKMLFIRIKAVLPGGRT